MTPEEIQAAKSSVENALFGWVEPSKADLVAVEAEAQLVAEQSAALAGDFIGRDESDDHVGKPTLQGSTA